MRTKDQVLLQEAYKSVLEMAYGVAGSASAQRSITQAQLVDLIKQVEQDRPGTNFIGVTQITKEQSNKAPYPAFVLSGLKSGKSYFAKVSQVNGFIGANYSDIMNRRRAEQGMTADFVAQKSAYEGVEGSVALREKEGQIYIQYFPKTVAKKFAPVLVKAKTDNPSTSADFEVTTKEDVAQFKGPPRPAAPVSVTTRTISLASIAAIKINKQEYVITDLDPVRKAIWEISGAPMPQDNPEEEESAPPAETPENIEPAE